MNVFQRAFAGLNLSPGERAGLKLIQGFALAGVLAVAMAAPAFISYRAGQPALAAGAVSIAVGAFIHAFLAAWAKYVSAKGDTPLASAITAVDAAAQQALGQANDLKTPGGMTAQPPVISVSSTPSTASSVAGAPVTVS